MRRMFLVYLFLVLLGCLDLSIPLYSQVSFSQPPLFSGTGNLFVADFNGDGKLDILCSDGTLNLGNGDGTFTKGVSVSGVPLVVADFNGDGKPDILEQTTGTLVVLLGNGDGTFQSPINTASGATLLAVAAGNLTSSTKADVVGVFNNSLIVYISNGDGTFAHGVSYALGTNPPAALLSLGDFNGDGKTDVVVTAFYGTSSAVDEITLLGNGDGTLQKATTTSGLPNQSVTGVVVGDFNGDGRLDLAIGTPSATSCLSNCEGAVSLMLGNGDGTFQPPQSAFSTSARGGVLAAADLNGDGKVDLVLETASVAQIYLGNGDGTFSNKSNYLLFPQSGVSFPSSEMALGDFNGDKKDDLAAGNAVLLGNGDGTFQGVPLALVAEQPSFAVVGQFNKAGAPGVATVAANASPGAQTYSLYILSNNGSGVLSLAHTYTLQNSGELATADLNGDGNLDLVVVGTDPNTQLWSYSVLLGNGDGSFQAPVFYPQAVGGGNSVVVADFNNDHKPDLAVAAGSQTVAILLGNGDGTFAAPVYYYDAGGSPLLVADFNGDGKLDIAAGEYGNPILTGILLGNSDGTFQPAIFPASLNGFWAQFTADFNNDGIPDLMSFNQVALGSGGATFTLLPQIPQAEMGIVAEATGDLNGDGKLDIFVNETTGNQSQQGGVELGNGDGTFGSIIEVPMSTNFPPFPVLLADMNGDGLPDLVFLWQSSFTGEGPSGVGVMLNTTHVVSQPDFQLVGSGFSPSPVTAGSSATSTITINPLNGFMGNVALSCSGLPSGTSCSFSPTSISGGAGSSTLTVTTSSSLTAGRYTFTITGSSGNQSRIVVPTITVASGSAADFQISATAASPASVPPGGSATSTLTVAPLGGFGNVVNLTCGSEVGGVSCALNPTYVTPSLGNNPTSTLTISTTSGARSGAYPISISGTSGSILHSTGVTLVVSPDFTLGAASGSQTSQTISAGQNAQFTLALAPAGSFTGTVNLSCSITPVVTTGPTCQLSTSSVQITGTSGTQNVTVTVGTTASSSAVLQMAVQPIGPLALAFLLLGTAPVLCWRRRSSHLAVPVLTLALLALSCGGTSSSRQSQVTPSGTYTATITATAGSKTHTTTFQVIVQ